MNQHILLPQANELGQRCIHAFTSLVPASLCAFYRVDERLEAQDFLLYRMTAQMHRAYLEHYRHLDPLKPLNCAASGRSVVSLQLGSAQQGRRDTELYQGFLQRNGVCDVVEIIALDNHRPIAGLSMLRDASLGRFNPNELAALHALQGLLELAARSPFEHPDRSTDERLQGLTSREREIALLLRDGVCNKTLAQRLEVGLPTVKTHLINLFRKVGVRNRTELVGALFL
ncbi:helix-turn-helix transcriptional regulator [Pseudomonas sp. 2FG]|uniref:helix-turn-helix transcriptional regulator n=1 Tax=Pseudomonas sp. 2FG TaxID=2502191 RepID=UPI0010FA3501|nr:helix-turn-helix transcriptional regulator [Pseudomonas sp. 2FG]